MGYLKLGTINNLCNDQKEKSVNQQKEQKIVKNPNGGIKMENIKWRTRIKIEKLQKNLKIRQKGCHENKIRGAKKRIFYMKSSVA